MLMISDKASLTSFRGYNEYCLDFIAYSSIIEIIIFDLISKTQ